MTTDKLIIKLKTNALLLIIFLCLLFNKAEQVIKVKHSELFKIRKRVFKIFVFIKLSQKLFYLIVNYYYTKLKLYMFQKFMIFKSTY